MINYKEQFDLLSQDLKNVIDQLKDNSDDDRKWEIFKILANLFRAYHEEYEGFCKYCDGVVPLMEEQAKQAVQLSKQD